MAQPQADQQTADSQHAARNAAIVALAAQQLSQAWPQIDWAAPQAVDAVKKIYAAIVTRYGTAAASVAAEFYDQQRAAALPQAGNFRATPADPIPVEVLDTVVESAFRGTESVDGEPQTTSDLAVDQRVPARLEASLQRHVQQPARDTVTQNVVADPANVRYVRVPQGPDPCAFCIMLASRQLGPIEGPQKRSFGGYSKNSAQWSDEKQRYIHVFTGRGQTPVTSKTGKRQVGEEYHDHCHCEPMPVFGNTIGGVEEVSPNFTNYQEMYAKASAEAGSSNDTKAILSAMRRVYKVR